MSPEEIIEAYNVVAQDVQNQAAQDAAIIGNSQRSLGPLAAAVASPSGQTSGLANYTYNRLMRPTLESTTTGLITQGKAQALQTGLTNELLAAKSRYEDAKNAYTVAASAPKTTTGGDGETYDEKTDTEVTGEVEPYLEEGTYIGTGSTGKKWGWGDNERTKYVVTFNDGQGGFHSKTVWARNPEEAKRATTVIGVGGTGNGYWYVTFADGTNREYIANSAEEAKKRYYADKEALYTK